MLEAIASAKQHVHLETYIFIDDEVGTEFAEALAAKARTGVSVRIIYDSIGSREAGRFLAGARKGRSRGTRVQSSGARAGPEPVRHRHARSPQAADRRRPSGVHGRHQHRPQLRAGVRRRRRHERVIGMARHACPHQRACRRRLSATVRRFLGAARRTARRAAVRAAAAPARQRQHARARAVRRRRRRRSLGDLGRLPSRHKGCSRSNLDHAVLFRARRRLHGRRFAKRPAAASTSASS